MAKDNKKRGYWKADKEKKGKGHGKKRNPEIKISGGCVGNGICGVVHIKDECECRLAKGHSGRHFCEVHKKVF